MALEVTDEMREILDRASGRTHSADGAVIGALREILAIIERDYHLRPVCIVNAELMPGVRCWLFDTRHSNHEARLPSGKGVTWEA